MKLQEKPIGYLISLFRQGPKPVLLLGAGASVKSGIPTTTEFIDQASKWAYAKENGLPTEDTRIRRSDWLPWMEKKTWYNKAKPSSDIYPEIVDNLLQPRQARKEFFIKILNPQVPVSVGYEKLAELIGNGVLESILTTNFDNLVVAGCNNTLRVHYIEVIKNPDDLSKFSTSPEYPQLIHLHGDVENYTDRNLIDEVEKLNDNLVENIVPLLRDHPLIVVGYRGGENSIMKYLLMQNAKKAGYYKRGIYWCILENDHAELHDNVKELAHLIGNNLQLVRIAGFDELMTNNLFESFISEAYWNNISSPHRVTPPPVNDFKLIRHARLSDLDDIMLKSRLIRYCRSLRLPLPDDLTNDWLTNFEEEKDLVKHEKDCTYPTFAGLALFGKNPQNFLNEFKVLVKIENDVEWLNHIFQNSYGEDESEVLLERIVEGNLWEQLDELTEILSVFNKSFRLKSEVSETVLPYPSIALKELLVNALVHRDYEVENPIKIDIHPTYIEIRNVGGLVYDVQSMIGTDSLEEKIKRGKRGLKGYRNPVLADFFYGAGAMDKAGSGLSDVYQMVEKEGGQVSFGPDDQNKSFLARIYSRPDAINFATQTSAPKTEIKTTFVSNVLEFISLPKVVFIAKANFNKVSEIWENFPEAWTPPFQQISKGRVISFFDLSSNQSVLRKFIDPGTLEAIQLDEFLEDPNMEREFVKLMNRCLYSHFYTRGLISDKFKKRVYFPKENDESNRRITYQARIKSATRTVAKRIIKKSTSEILYWEHKSFSFHVEKFGNKWGLVILPSYVFTVDGLKWLVASDKISRLATKRSSRDYNMTVLNDFNFWTWVLASGKKNHFFLETSKLGEDPFYDEEIIGLSSTLPKSRIVKVDDPEVYDKSSSTEDEDDDFENEIAELAKEEIGKKGS